MITKEHVEYITDLLQLVNITTENFTAGFAANKLAFDGSHKILNSETGETVFTSGHFHIVEKSERGPLPVIVVPAFCKFGIMIIKCDLNAPMIFPILSYAEVLRLKDTKEVNETTLPYFIEEIVS